MKWPIASRVLEMGNIIYQTDYVTVSNRLIIDTEKCTTCAQCVRVCPRGALERPAIPRGVRVPKRERIPVMAHPLKCVFCGLCAVMCPFGAISLAKDGKLMEKNEYPVVKTGRIPEITSVKVGKVEYNEQSPGADSELWKNTLEKIVIRKK